jgi:5-methylthioadenosine/S-adenosylhomocysteine deaminase
MKKWSIKGLTIVTPEKIVENSTIVLGNGKILEVTKKDTRTQISLSLEEGVLCPGLINSHDHLLGTYYPKVGNGPYPNWLPWDNDLKSSPIYRERQQIQNRDLYLLGAYRNLISGVTSVQDHMPHFVQDQFLDVLPLKVISDFAISHSIASFSLNWGDTIEVEYKKAIDEDIPFITHIAEGFDEETVQDLKVLAQKGALGDHSVLVHGIAFSEEDIELIKEKHASVVWCGDSNYFMFERTVNVGYMLDMGVNVCIGTDSPMSGGENILSEMKFDKQYYQGHYGQELSDAEIVKMVTSNPARAFLMKKNGHVAEGYIADLVVFAHKDKDPYRSIVSAGLADVKLVIIDGMPVYGDKEYENVFASLGVKAQAVTIAGVEKLIIGDLSGVIHRIQRAVGFKKEFPFLPIQD